MSEFIDSLGVVSRTDALIEVTLWPGSAITLYIEHGAETLDVRIDLDEAQALHEALGHLLWQTRG